MRTWSLFIAVVFPAVFVTPAIAQESEFELATYSPERRWNRSAQLLIAVQMADIMEKKAEGKTAEQIGRMSFEAYGPPQGWTGSDTPWKLFRGMYYNWMSNPEQRCELLEASDAEVVARCNRPWAGFIDERGPAYGVSVGEYETVGLVFCQGIAEYHGLEWIQERNGNDFRITVRKK